MEGVGARLGRTSTRYGAPTTTVFNGRVRKWKKRWVHLSSPNTTTTNNNNSNQNHVASSNGIFNGNSNGTNGNSRLLLYKWTPLTNRSKDSNNNGKHNASDSSPNNNNDDGNDNVSNGSDGVESEPPRRRFKYIPVDQIEREKIEAAEREVAEKDDGEANMNDGDSNAVDSTPKNNGFNGKPDINDVPMEENQDDRPIVRQDLNESTLDLSHDDDTNSKPDESKDGQLERGNASVGR